MLRQSRSLSTDTFVAFMIQEKVLTEEQGRVVQAECRLRQKQAGHVAVELGFVSESVLDRLLSTRCHVEHVALQNRVIDPEIIELIPRKLCEDHVMFPVRRGPGGLVVALSDPENFRPLDTLARHLPLDIPLARPVYASTSSIIEAIHHYYGFEISLEKLLSEIEQTHDQEFSPETSGFENATVRFVNALLLDAVKRGSSDIHCEPENAFVRLRYRLDGLLQPLCLFHKKAWPALLVRLKVISRMNIAETRRPQGGRFSQNIMGRDVDFRVSTHPTTHGESLSLRILDKTRSLMPLEELGYTDHLIEQLMLCLKKPAGLIIVTGPTGSGKTTSLYSMLSLLNTQHVKIMTLEDPVEYALPMIRQTDINEACDMNFAEGIRSILRQDPDIILIGEIRDKETAQMAVRAALTGHKVFTTLHTHDALGALQRLKDLDVSFSLLTGHLTCIMAQRLIRRLCSVCKRPATLGEGCEAVGCHKCRHTGYSGRQVMAEIIIFDTHINSLIHMDKPRHYINQSLKKRGWVSLDDVGNDLLKHGVTSIQELQRTEAQT